MSGVQGCLKLKSNWYVYVIKWSSVIALKRVSSENVFLFPQHAKGESFDLGEFFQALPRKQHAQVWTALLLLTQSAVDTLSEMVGEDECKVGCPFFHGDQKMLCTLFQTKCAPPLSAEVVLSLSVISDLRPLLHAPVCLRWMRLR